MSNKLYVLVPTAFFRAAPNNRKDHDKMMAWRRSMCTNIRYMIPGEKIKRKSKRTEYGQKTRQLYIPTILL